MKKVLILSQSLKVNSGGGGKVVSLLANHMPAEVVLCLYDGSNIAYPVSCKVIDLKLISSKNIFIRAIRPFQRFFRLRGLKQKLKPDLTISLPDNVNILNILTRVGDKIIIRSDYSQNSKYRRGLEGKFLVFLLRYIYKYTDKIISNSEGVKQALLKDLGIHKEKINVIYNPIDIRLIESKKKKELPEKLLKIFKNSQIIMNAGRLSEPKAQWNILYAFAKIKSKLPVCKLVILGDGPYRKELTDLCESLALSYYASWEHEELSIDKSVYFLGFQENPYQYLTKADLFLFTSTWEGFPNGVLDALACGVPIVSSDCRSGPREILAPGTDPNFETDKVEFAENGVLLPVIYSRIAKPLNDVNLRKIDLWVKTIMNVLSDKKNLSNYHQRSLLRARDFDVSKLISKWKKML